MFLAESFNVEIGSGLVFAILCAVLAPGRGRSALAWFFIGLFLSCLGLIILLCLPDLNEETQKTRGADAELRRLREQVKKERMVADQRHQVHDARLDAHDRALGLDTAEKPPLPEPPPPPAQVTAGEPMWYFVAVDKQLGPVAESQLRELRKGGQVKDDTFVWREGMDDWVPYRDVPELG